MMFWKTTLRQKPKNDQLKTIKTPIIINQILKVHAIEIELIALSIGKYVMWTFASKVYSSTFLEKMCFEAVNF